MTQTFVAELLHVGQKTYSDYELGKTRIPLDSVIILARYYFRIKNSEIIHLI